jgi:hypothetical protein
MFHKIIILLFLMLIGEMYLPIIAITSFWIIIQTNNSLNPILKNLKIMIKKAITNLKKSMMKMWILNTIKWIIINNRTKNLAMQINSSRYIHKLKINSIRTIAKNKFLFMKTFKNKNNSKSIKI